MSIENAKTRLFVADALSNGAEIQLTPDHAHFLGNVLRFKVGDRVAVFNEKYGEDLYFATRCIY